MAVVASLVAVEASTVSFGTQDSADSAARHMVSTVMRTAAANSWSTNKCEGSSAAVP